MISFKNQSSVTNLGDLSPKNRNSGIWKVFGDLGIFRGILEFYEKFQYMCLHLINYEKNQTFNLTSFISVRHVFLNIYDISVKAWFTCFEISSSQIAAACACWQQLAKFNLIVYIWSWKKNRYFVCDNVTQGKYISF